MTGRPPDLTPVVASRVSRTTAFWSIAGVLLLVLAASAAPSPLYRVYQDQLGFGSGVLTVVFGIYAFALLASLLVVGALSDHIGRRPVVIAGLLVQTAAMVIFLVADDVGWLMAARVVQGVSTGALTGSLGAALLDFQRSDKPRGALVNSASPGLGLALGALFAGLLVAFAPHPTDSVFGVLVVAHLLAVGLVLRLPESSPCRPGTLASLRPQVHVPAAQRRDFLLVMPCVAATWALGGLYLSLGPSLASEVFGLVDDFAGALLIFVMQGASAIGSVLASRLPGQRAMVVGALTFAVGVAGTVGSLLTGSVAVFFGAAVISGLGFGSSFMGALATVTRGVAPGERAGQLSSVLEVGYLALSIPAILAGFAAAWIGLPAAAEIYGAVVIALALITVNGLRIRRRADARDAASVREPAAA